MIRTVGAIGDATPDGRGAFNDHDPQWRCSLVQEIGCDKGAAHATADDYYSFHVHEGSFVGVFCYGSGMLISAEANPQPVNEQHAQTAGWRWSVGRVPVFFRMIIRR
jgi:hypothetical protein